MPAPIIDSFLTYIATQLNVQVWDGEVQRFDPQGNPINPTVVASPSVWPVVRATMPELGFGRGYTTEDPYGDEGIITIEVWGTSRASEEGVLNQIEALLAQASNWPKILTGGPPENPFFIYSLLLNRWSSRQEEGVRTARNELLYKGVLEYELGIHGAIITL